MTQLEGVSPSIFLFKTPCVDMLAVKVVRLLAGAFLAACVAATDDGDDFSNNLFSDLAPYVMLTVLQIV